MDKKYIFIVILIIDLGLCFFYKNSINEPDEIQLACIQAGEFHSNISLGPDNPVNKDYDKKICCPGLTELSMDYIYEPTNEYAEENGCVLSAGMGSFCSNCGNNTCEEGENKCNCPKDCLNNF